MYPRIWGVLKIHVQYQQVSRSLHDKYHDQNSSNHYSSRGHQELQLVENQELTNQRMTRLSSNKIKYSKQLFSINTINNLVGGLTIRIFGEFSFNRNEQIVQQFLKAFIHNVHYMIELMQIRIKILKRVFFLKIEDSGKIKCVSVASHFISVNVSCHHFLLVGNGNCKHYIKTHDNFIHTLDIINCLAYTQM